MEAVCATCSAPAYSKPADAAERQQQRSVEEQASAPQRVSPTAEGVGNNLDTAA